MVLITRVIYSLISAKFITVIHITPVVRFNTYNSVVVCAHGRYLDNFKIELLFISSDKNKVGT